MNRSGTLTRHHILLVEDNPADALLVREALQASCERSELHVAEGGEEALAFLRRTGTHTAAPRPDLILLDLNLPRKDGREVLRELKTDEDLGCIPVIVLTTSNSDDDILKVYRLQANCFITKPLDFDRFTAVANSIEHFWLRTATLPSSVVARA